MPSINYRGWTFIDENRRVSDEDFKQIKPRADALSRRWSELHHQEEQLEFERHWRAEEQRDYDFEDDEEWLQWHNQHILDRELHRASVEAQYQYINEELEKLGCRMMRPYEHWNEDEAYMEYAERER